MMPAPEPPVDFRTAFWFWLKLGFISFGGPAGQIAIMHRELVERRRWISEERFMHALNYCMILPGPEAQQLATYIGWLLHGVRGGLVAGGLFILPSVFILGALSWMYAAHGDTSLVAGALAGFRAAVIAIVCEAVVRIGKRTITRPFHGGVAVAAFIAIQWLGVPFPAIVATAALAGWLESRRQAPRDGEATEPTSNATLPAPRRAIVVISAFALIWLGMLVAVVIPFGWDSLVRREYTFFTQAAFVTFGGAYAVLAYVSQAAVEQFQWLTHTQTIDGLALAETTPGPLIMVVQFVGFMAAWNQPLPGFSPLTSGIIGAVVTTAATFLPCFFFIFLGAPYIERLRSQRALDGAFRTVISAVVGVILNLAFVFGSAVVFPSGLGQPDWPSALVALAAFMALWRYHVDVLWVIAAAGLFGIIRSW